MTGAAPRISIVLVTDTYDTIRLVIDRLLAQTIHAEIEVVIVAPAARPVALDDAVARQFACVRVVPVASVWPMSAGRAAGVRASTAPLIFIGETHSFPHPAMAEQLARALGGPWDAVVPGLFNDNPATVWSWSSFLMDYGRWSDFGAGGAGGATDCAPTWNVAYKREVLLAFDGTLERVLAHGDEMALALQAAQRRLYFEPAARIDHANVSRPLFWIELRFLLGRVIGGGRARRWPWWRRAAYLVASPLIPFVLLRRIWPAIRALAARRVLPRGTTAAVILGAVISVAGEAAGYALGERPRTQARIDEFELHKLRFLREAVSR